MENVLFNDNCFNVFPTIPNASVQLVVVDLPYGCLNLKWDNKIDLDKMWIQLKRILKANGQCVFFADVTLMIELINSNKNWFRYEIIWDKQIISNPYLCGKRVGKSHEFILIFHNPIKPKNMNWIYNAIKQKLDKPYLKPIMKKTDLEQYKMFGQVNRRSGESIMVFEGTPTSIIKHISGKHRQNRLHPTQKPVELCEWLIKTYSNEGDLVLDFTMGSGSTVMACLNTNRKYIGIEMDETIFKVAEKRIIERN